MPYHVKTELFEGPLHLLLDLIEKRKLLINDISLASVADDFLAHVRAMPDLPLSEVAEFVSLAATLLLIKSRSLLPTLTLTQEEEADLAQLERRLALLKIMREGAGYLGKALLPTPLYAPDGLPAPFVFAPDRFTTTDDFLAAVERALFAFPTQVALPTVSVKTVISLEDMIIRLTERITREFKMSFRDFAGTGKAEKGEVIVSFLALLELVKQGILKADQDTAFGDINLETESVTTPSYGA